MRAESSYLTTVTCENQTQISCFVEWVDVICSFELRNPTWAVFAYEISKDFKQNFLTLTYFYENKQTFTVITEF